MGLAFFRVLSAILGLLVLIAGCTRMPSSTSLQTLPDIALPTAFTPGAIILYNGQELTFADLNALAQNYDYILIGETHANPCDHRFQRDVLPALTVSDAGSVLGLEMVPWSRQKTLDLFVQGTIPLEDLEERLGWREYWGYTFDLYGPILEQSRKLGMPIIGLNVPRDLLLRIKTDGLENIPDHERGLLPEEIIFPPQEQQRILEEEYYRHAQLDPHESPVVESDSNEQHGQAESGFDLQRFVLVQSLWDTQMASIAAAWKRETGTRMIILAGSGHVEYGYGIAHRLRTLEHNPRILTIIPWRGDTLEAEAADLFYFCPEPPRRRLGLEIVWVNEQAVLGNVLAESIAEAAGLRPGDILLQAGDTPITSLDVLHHAGREALESGGPLRLKILRVGNPLDVNLAF